jgi:O-antigen/teichoic acid export membrane protein
MTFNVVIKSIKWSLLDRVFSAVSQFAIGILIARVLLPRDYGLISMLAFFMSISQLLIDGGFTTAIIQKKNISQTEQSSVFFVNLILAISIYCILYLTAPFISNFYNEPQLVNIIRVMGLLLISSSLGLIQNALLTKSLDFKSLTKISLTASLISGICAYILALNNFGVWALVLQQLMRSMILNIFLWLKSKWRPSIVINLKAISELRKFSINILFSGLLNAIFDNIYYAVIAKLFSANKLGFYTRANQLQQFPVSLISSVVQRVFLPTMTNFSDDTVKLKYYYKNSIKVLALLVFPLMMLFNLLSGSIVFILLTEKWLPLVPMLQIMLLYGMFYPIHAVNLDILNVMGRSDLFLKLEIIKKIIIGLTLIITSQLGINAMILGTLVLTIGFLPLNIFYVNKVINYKLYEQIADFKKPLLFSIVVSILLYPLKFVFSQHLVLILVTSLLFFMFFILFLYIFERGLFNKGKGFIFKNKML